MTLQEEIIAELKTEIEGCDESILESKVKGAIREVKGDLLRYVRNAPESWVDKEIARYFSQIKNLALYDYNMVGNEGQISGSENGISRSYMNREKLKAGIVPMGYIS